MNNQINSFHCREIFTVGVAVTHVHFGIQLKAADSDTQLLLRLFYKCYGFVLNQSLLNIIFKTADVYA